MTAEAKGISRRRFVAALAGLASTTGLAERLLAAEGGEAAVTREALAGAEELIDIELTDTERELMMDGLAELREDYRAIRGVELDNSVPPALVFDPRIGGETPASGPDVVRPSAVLVERPGDADEVAFLPLTHLSRLVRERRISSRELTELFLERIERHDPTLRAVIEVTAERALAEADRADLDLAAKRWRGPLHGIPWGAKDLLAAEGTRTTWGAMPYRDQRIEKDATVVRRLEDAGAVLVAKLSLGALAWGDVWFDATTKNPWNPEQGSSGSSAGPAAATAAGMVGFSIGSETWGSIVSPATRCGVTGLRPSFGTVSRHGAMALSWSMDKLGPMCRSVEDCALVFAAIHGPDGLDPSVAGGSFRWEPDRLEPGRVRVGYPTALFEKAPDDGDTPPETEEELTPEQRARLRVGREQRKLDRAVPEVLRGLGFDLVPIELPDLPISALSLILTAEAAAAFDRLTRSGEDDTLVRQVERAWPNVFRTARTIPAVEYINANRIRTLLLREMARLFTDVDCYVAPSFGGHNLLLTNLTGHPAVVLPNGFRSDGTPGSITFVGRLFDEGTVLAVAKRYQDETGWHERRPVI